MATEFRGTFDQWMESTEGRAKVRPASNFEDQVIETMFPVESETRRAMLPWRKAHDFEFRPGEVTLWVGVNGHGKSMLQGQCVTSLCAQGYKCCIASFEMFPRKTLARMARQSSQHTPTEAMVRSFSKWTDGKLWLYDHQGSIKPRFILAVARYCAAELGIEHFVIDSMMKVVPKEDDYNSQKDFVNDLGVVARDSGMHIHLVHHARKGEDEFKAPGKMDAKGSGAITDMVDNVLIVWRNKKKEIAAKGGKPIDGPDAMLICEKQRNGDAEPRYTLTFDPGSTQYLAGSNLFQDLTVWGSERKFMPQAVA
jgi:twinkle protein